MNENNHIIVCGNCSHQFSIDFITGQMQRINCPDCDTELMASIEDEKVIVAQIGI